MLTFITTVILCYLLVVTFVFYQRNLLYHPFENNYATDKANFEYEEIFVQHPMEKELKAWFHKKILKKKDIIIFSWKCWRLKK